MNQKSVQDRPEVDPVSTEVDLGSTGGRSRIGRRSIQDRPQSIRDRPDVDPSRPEVDPGTTSVDPGFFFCETTTEAVKQREREPTENRPARLENANCAHQRAPSLDCPAQKTLPAHRASSGAAEKDVATKSPVHHPLLRTEQAQAQRGIDGRQPGT
jgi:hypothetical protein